MMHQRQEEIGQFCCKFLHGNYSFPLYYIVINLEILVHLHADCVGEWTYIMGKFYLDTEFTNGNYYLADVIAIALIAVESGNTFQLREDTLIEYT